jgi:hypothetical protein
MPQTISPKKFVAKWSRSTLKDSTSTQQHVLDICRLIGHPLPAEVDPEWGVS